MSKINIDFNDLLMQLHNPSKEDMQRSGFLHEKEWRHFKLKPEYESKIAECIARYVFEGQTRRSGKSTLSHTEAVAKKSEYNALQYTIAWLHDVVEDSNLTIDDLKFIGFCDTVVESVNALTKRQGEPYLDFIVRCAKNSRAAPIKKDDIADNKSDPENVDQNRMMCYKVAYSYLIAIENRQIAPGDPIIPYILKQTSLLKDENMSLEKFKSFSQKNSSYAWPALAKIPTPA